eukprot:Gregarina_sp_Poly_1__1138@NODE_1279_length_4511_cov_34_076508_g85_i1_p1_GENE_NODE_1279_length_4511_cov_34_076508_g85_i1NODE_1279_length_4511_cov_34_076508_g85_i1_p1_ORF_typecomplete_len449_score29_48_NODE_1279_length_4511_cov_34_076508_g85_i14771823
MFKVYMPHGEVPNASLSNIRFAACKIFVVQDTCVCLPAPGDNAAPRQIRFPLKARGFFMGDGDGVHYTFRYVAVQAPQETQQPLSIWKPLPGTWKFPCVPPILLATAITMAVCFVMAFPLMLGRVVFCVLYGSSWTIRNEAVGPIVTQSFSRLMQHQNSSNHFSLHSLPNYVMDIDIATTKHTDLQPYVLGCAFLWIVIRIARELSSESSWTNTLYTFIQRSTGGILNKAVKVSRLLAFGAGMMFVFMLIPTLQGAMLDLVVIRPDVWHKHPLGSRHWVGLLQCHVQWFLIGCAPFLGWLSLLYVSHFGMWIHPTPYAGTTTIPTDVLQELSATMLDIRWTSRGVAADRRKISLLYKQVVLPLLGDFIALIVRPTFVSLALNLIIIKRRFPMYNWMAEFIRRPVGALLVAKFASKALMQGWREVVNLHSTIWQNRYVISTILCNSEPD